MFTEENQYLMLPRCHLPEAVFRVITSSLTSDLVPDDADQLEFTNSFFVFLLSDMIHTQTSGEIWGNVSLAQEHFDMDSGFKLGLERLGSFPLTWTTCSTSRATASHVGKHRLTKMAAVLLVFLSLRQCHGPCLYIYQPPG